MKFGVEEPFYIGVKNSKNGHISKKDLGKDFWDNVNGKRPGLPKALGCYIFATESRKKKSKPWYVGKTEKSTFQLRCKQSISNFNESTNGTGGHCRKGKPQLFFIPLLTEGGKYSKGKKAANYVKELEQIIINYALLENHALTNVVGTTILKNITVEGFLNANDNVKNGAHALRRMFPKSKKARKYTMPKQR